MLHFSTFFLSGGKLGFCVLPNTCIGLGISVLSALELRQEGLTFNNYASPISADDTLSMGWITLMLLVDTFVYMVLSWSAIACVCVSFSTLVPISLCTFSAHFFILSPLVDLVRLFSTMTPCSVCVCVCVCVCVYIP